VVEPWALVSDSNGQAALTAGYFAARVGLPAPPTAPAVRDVQRRQLEVALPWAARELGLREIDGKDVCDRDVIRLGLALASGSAVRRGSTFSRARKDAVRAARGGGHDGRPRDPVATHGVPDQAATQAVPELGPPIIVTFHNLGDAGQDAFLQRFAKDHSFE
jgi:hypothetical protein